MSSAPAKLIAALATLWLASEAAHATPWQCEGGIVQPGDLEYHVTARCGQPFWVDRWLEEEVFGPDQPIETRQTFEVQEWFFNLGPNRLIRRLRIRNGQLVDIEELGYGESPNRRQRSCSPNSFLPGLTTGEIILRCGPPDWQDRQFGAQVLRNTGVFERATLLNIQTWLYDFGRNRFTRILRFENGVLTNVDVGDKGLLSR